MAISVPSIKLNDGVEMPLVGMGSFMGKLNFKSSESEETINVFKRSIDLGYRHFDAAAVYNTEDMLGSALVAKIQDGTVRREELFITTKLSNCEMRADQVVSALKNSLQRLKLDYVDNYIIHWPVALAKTDWTKNIFEFDDDISLVDTWKAMEECKKLGLTRSIGLSNFNRRQMQLILDNCTIKPTNNQNEVHVYLQNKELIEFCKKNDVVMVCYSPLVRSKTVGQVNISSDSTLSSLAQKYGKSNEQIALKFLVQQGLPVVPKSANPKRQFDNMNLFDFEISEHDMETIGDLDRNIRLNGVGKYCKLTGNVLIFTTKLGNKEYPFTERILK